jgi:PadR family transcriptional regulator PadR
VFEPVDLLQGTLDLLILKALSLESNHGLGVARRVEQLSGETFRVRPGSLFPALHRLEERGWVTAEWGESANRRRAKFYTLTRLGRSQLRTETSNWKRIALAITRSLEVTSFAAD